VADRICGPSRAATAEIAARPANTGRDDPTIGARLGITVDQAKDLLQRENER
jgi:hypothetical protein